MGPGEVIFDRDPDAAVAALRHWDDGVATVYECAAGADAAQERQIDHRYKAIVAKVAALLGPPDMQPTRAQGLTDPPKTLDPAWRRAAVWRGVETVTVVTVSGGSGKMHAIEIVRAPRRRSAS